MSTAEGMQRQVKSRDELLVGWAKLTTFKNGNRADVADVRIRSIEPSGHGGIQMVITVGGWSGDRMNDIYNLMQAKHNAALLAAFDAPKENS